MGQSLLRVTRLNASLYEEASEGVKSELWFKVLSEGSIIIQCMLSESKLLWHRKEHLHKTRRHRRSGLQRREVLPNILNRSSQEG